MSFISTRGGACVTASQAILRGLAPDGGLYVPAVFPQMTLADIAALTKLDYRARALTIAPSSCSTASARASRRAP